MRRVAMFDLRRPLDWTRGAGRPLAERPRSVDIIVPVFGAAEALRACIASVEAHTDLATHRLLLVLDGPQDDAVEAAIAHCAHVLRGETRAGFTGAVNRGMRASSTDVVLLNSDTIVTARWIEKLIDAAYSSGDIGTVTPLSNHATLCSVPRAFAENLLPARHDAHSFAALIERVSAREYPRLPTGHGFCFYIRRALLDEIGFFDEKHFPLGYGEENDFSMRALRRGWLHVMDDATFIAHVGHASFGASRNDAMRRGAAALRRKHRRYTPTIAAFMKRDPAANVRARIETALGVSETRPRVVHLGQGWPPFHYGGVESYASWLVREQQREHHVAVYTRGDDTHREEGEAIEWNDRGVRVRIVTNRFTSRDPFRRNALFDRALEADFARFLSEERPDLLHVHHFAGHAFSLARVAKKMNIPIVLQLHDWWLTCARINRFDRDGDRCSGPALAKCARCVTLSHVAPNRAMHALRRRLARKALLTADVLLGGSRAIAEAFDVPVEVIPYGVDLTPIDARPPVKKPIRFGYVGALLPHKGVHTAVAAMRDLEDAELHLWGNDSSDYAKSLRAPNVHRHGAFRDEEKASVYASIDVLIVPSIGLESFGLVAREAMARRVPVIATRGGALAELEDAEFFDAGDVDGLRAILRRLIDDPSSIDRWSARLPVPKSSEAHAREIARLYEGVLAKR